MEEVKARRIEGEEKGSGITAENQLDQMIYDKYDKTNKN